MQDILSIDRVIVDVERTVTDKSSALAVLGELLGPALEASPDTIVKLLHQRELLQSTGIGDGVAIPHAFLDSATGQSAPRQTAAIVICPRGIDFAAIDGEPVTIIVGIVGPKSAEHLRVLAAISWDPLESTCRHASLSIL